VLEIRPVQPAEHARVGDLTVAAYRDLPVDHLWDGYDDEIRAVSERIETADVLVAVLDEPPFNGMVVGAVTYVSDPSSPWMEWNEPDEAQIRLLGVEPSAQGHGVGAALVNACIERARSCGLKLLLHTTNHMPAAQRLYSHLGFARRPERDVHDYEAEHDLTFMAYTLDPQSAGPRISRAG
jgi:ribosomal protein S18 acetylase RimI-like enzyme